MRTQEPNAFGSLLRYWRGARKMSQLDMAVEARVSGRHVSFVETGRSTPSREMVLLLADVLEVPLRERNTLLVAAGYAPVFRETDLGAPELRVIRRSLECVLEHHNPYPSILVDRHWNILLQNAASIRLFPRFLANPAALEPPLNSIRLLFDPNGLRPFILNWEEVAASMIQRLHRDLAAAPNDEACRTLRDELLATPGVRPEWRLADYGMEHPMILTMRLKKDDVRLNLFSAITIMDTPLDVTLQELRVDTLLPADEETEQTLQALCGSA